MNAKHGLGRGLGALLSPSPAPSPSAESAASNVQELPIDSIVANPRQPRKTFDDNTLRDLAQSLKRSGVLQPVIVRRHGQQFQIVVGERRWRAAAMAGLSHIPAVVREATDAETLELALVENLLREDLNPMEEAEAYQRLLAEFDWTQELRPYQANVIDKLLFGSDFPYTNAEECIESLYSINQLAQGTNLPVVPREALRGIVERDALGLLGLG